jgi:hypothetical protein
LKVRPIVFGVMITSVLPRDIAFGASQSPSQALRFLKHDENSSRADSLCGAEIRSSPNPVPGRNVVTAWSVRQNRHSSMTWTRKPTRVWVILALLKVTRTCRLSPAHASPYWLRVGLGPEGAVRRCLTRKAGTSYVSVLVWTVCPCWPSSIALAKYDFDSWTAENGLPQNTSGVSGNHLTSLYESNDGASWIGSDPPNARF